jgi:hypothetical protein
MEEKLRQKLMNSRKRKKLDVEDIPEGPMKKVILQLTEYKEFSSVLELLSIPQADQYDCIFK